MKLTPISINIEEYPAELHSLLVNSKLYDSSCSQKARVVFIDKDGGYFLKSSPKGALENETALTRYFHCKGLSAGVLQYISKERDWLLTEKIRGDDCITDKYLGQPERLCDRYGCGTARGASCYGFYRLPYSKSHRTSALERRIEQTHRQL